MPIVLLVCHVVATVAALPGQKMIQNEEDKSLQQRRARLLFLGSFVSSIDPLSSRPPSLCKNLLVGSLQSSSALNYSAGPPLSSISKFI
jgi:hypothetical protein